MATRGRPTLFQTTTHLKTLRETYSADTTDRTNANRFYQQVAVDTLIEPNRDSIPGADRLEKARGCLEQLGRMIDGGTMDTGDILTQAQIAAKALEDGRTVKQVENYLRHGRIHDDWINSFLKPLPENKANTTGDTAKRLTLNDLRAIEWILDEEIQIYIKDIEAFSEAENNGEDNTDKIVTLANRARFIEQYQKKLQEIIKEQGGEVIRK